MDARTVQHRRRRPHRSADQLLPGWLNSLVRIVLGIAVLMPVGYLVILSLSPEADVEAGQLIPSRVSMDNFVGAWDVLNLGQGFANSVVACGGAALITVLLATAAAYPLARWGFPGSRILFYGTLGLQLVPGPMLLLPMFLVYSALQALLGITVIGSYWGLVLSYVGFALPLTIWLMVGYVRSLPKEIEEAAWVDGASRTVAFWLVVAPLALPGMVVAFVLALLQAWNDVLFASVLTNDTTRTLAVDLKLFTLAASQDAAPQYAQLMAAGVFMSVPVVAVYLVLQRYLVGGLAAGSVK
jgi:multiple sugar transport system permease protein